MVCLANEQGCMVGREQPELLTNHKPPCNTHANKDHLGTPGEAILSRRVESAYDLPYDES